MIDSSIPTFAQYRDGRRRNARQEYGITAREALEYYPEHALSREWQSLIEAAVRAGDTLPPAVCDSYCRQFTEPGFLRTFRGVDAHGIPLGYLPPSVRRAGRVRLATERAGHDA